MVAWVPPSQLERLRSGERFLTAGKVSSVERSENRIMISIGPQRIIAFKPLELKKGDTVRVLGRMGRELPIAEAVRIVPEGYLKLFGRGQNQLVEDLGEVE